MRTAYELTSEIGGQTREVPPVTHLAWKTRLSDFARRDANFPRLLEHGCRKTLSCCGSCLDLGAPFVEIDVRVSSHNVPFLWPGDQGILDRLKAAERLVADRYAFGGDDN